MREESRERSRGKRTKSVLELPVRALRPGPFSRSGRRHAMVFLDGYGADSLHLDGFTGGRPYSCLNARTGSVTAARTAGTSAPTAATTTITTATWVNRAGSVGRT